MKVYLTESTTPGQHIDNTETSAILLQSPNIHSCHYTPTHAPKDGLILAS